MWHATPKQLAIIYMSKWKKCEAQMTIMHSNEYNNRTVTVFKHAHLIHQSNLLFCVLGYILIFFLQFKVLSNEGRWAEKELKPPTFTSKSIDITKRACPPNAVSQDGLCLTNINICCTFMPLKKANERAYIISVACKHTILCVVGLWLQP